jgi:predicted nucleic acid-binding protein
MIIVDNTVLVDFWVGDADCRQAARMLFRDDPDWYAPDLWKYEFGNVIRKYVRAGRISSEVKKGAWVGCLKMVTTIHEVDVFAVDVFAVDDVAESGGLKFYDASYVSLAMKLGLKLRTRDSGILEAFPEVAEAMPKIV